MPRPVIKNVLVKETTSRKVPPKMWPRGQIGSFATLTNDLRGITNCIAPTTQRTSCNWTLNAKDLESARCIMAVLGQHHLTLSDRRDLLSDVVLFLCCREYHQDKLEIQPACLSQLVDRYLDVVADSNTTFGNEIATDMKSLPRYQRSSAYFVPYKTNPGKSLVETLETELTTGEKSDGFLYCLQCPKYLGYVKIGWTETPDNRIEGLQKCFPGGVMAFTIPTAFPKRAEKLVHLQMVEKRCKIRRCSICEGTHVEWFKASLADVRDVMRDTVTLLTRSSFYDQDRKISDMWRAHLTAFAAASTAGHLLDTMKQEQSLSYFDDFMQLVTKLEHVRLS